MPTHAVLCRAAFSLALATSSLLAVAQPAQVVRIGVQEGFPPIEFRAPGGELTGAGAQLLAEAMRRLGWKAEHVPVEYGALVDGVTAGRFDIASGGISDSVEREQQLDFVNWLRSGGALLLLATHPGKLATIDDFCGRRIATLRGSQVILAALAAASGRCTQAGHPAIGVEQFATAAEARRQLDEQGADAYLADFAALSWLASQSPGQYRIAGGNFILAPYITSWGFAKHRIELRDAVHKTMQAMLEDGTYRRILDRWGLGGGALPAITINLPASRR